MGSTQRPKVLPFGGLSGMASVLIEHGKPFGAALAVIGAVLLGLAWRRRPGA